MLNPDLFNFLDELKKNNNKEWFDTNRNRYKDLRQHFMNFVTLLIHELTQMDPSLNGLESSQTVFRINRDIRFSKDKSPYKTNMGAYIAPGGKKSFRPGYYLHVEPGSSMIAGGMYMPPSKELKMIRKEILENTEEFKRIINDKDFKKTYGELYGEKLKTAPQGFPKDHPDIDLMRYKSYTVFKEVSDEYLTGPDALNQIIDDYHVLKPFNDFLIHAMRAE